MYQFDRDTEVVGLGKGAYAGRVSAAYNIGDRPNGGYLAVLAVRALMREVAHPHPITVTTHFLRPGLADADCSIQVQLLRSGRSLSTARAGLLQDGRQRLEVLATFGRLDEGTGLEQTLAIPRPAMPPPEECVLRTGELQGIDLPIMRRLEVRLDETQLHGSAEARLAGHIRFADGRPVDLPALLMFTDTFPPSPFSLLGRVGWVPTVELTVQLRARPQLGWVSGVFRTDDLQGGRMIESACLWDGTGRLVTQSRQLGLVIPG